MFLQALRNHETLGLVDSLDYQERHSPTLIEEIKIKVPGGERVTRERVRRRSADAAMWGGVNSTQASAAECIATGFQIITNGLSARGQLFEKRYGRGDPGKSEELLRYYHKWASLCVREGVNVDMLLELIVSGRGYWETDRLYGRRRGTAKENFLNGLRVYIRLRRWKEREK